METSQAVHKFRLSPEEPNLQLTFADDDFTEAKKTFRETGLDQFTVQDIADFLDQLDGEDGVEHIRFLRTFPSLLKPSKEVTVIPLLDSVFRLLDRNQNGTVSADELCSALAVYVSGSKSDKLTDLWYLFSSEDQVTLSRSALWRLFRSLLSGVFALSSFARRTDRLTTIQQIDDCAGEIVENLIEYCGKETSFDSLGAWYNSGAHTSVEWMELLDMRKWPILGHANNKPKVQNTGAEQAVRPPVAPDEHMSASAPPVESGKGGFRLQIGSQRATLALSNQTFQMLRYLYEVVGFRGWKSWDIPDIFHRVSDCRG